MALSSASIRVRSWRWEGRAARTAPSASSALVSAPCLAASISANCSSLCQVTGVCEGLLNHRYCCDVKSQTCNQSGINMSLLQGKIFSGNACFCICPGHLWLVRNFSSYSTKLQSGASQSGLLLGAAWMCKQSYKINLGGNHAIMTASTDKKTCGCCAGGRTQQSVC